MSNPHSTPASNPPLLQKFFRAQVTADLASRNIDLADSGWDFLASRYLRLITLYIISPLIEFVLSVGTTWLLFTWIAPANQISGFLVLLLLTTFAVQGTAQAIRLRVLLNWYASRQMPSADAHAQP